MEGIDLKLTNKVALITGATRGIGLAIAEKLLEANASVIITGTSQESFSKTNNTLIKYGNRVSFLDVDLGNDQSFFQFLEKIKTMKIDILINNAGINRIDLSHEVKEEDWDLINKINLKAPFRIIQTVIPSMLQQNFGRIVNISSVFGTVSKSKRISYSTTKFGLHGITKASALDYATKNILINTVSPGFIDTELTRTILSSEEIAELVALVPMKRLGSVYDVANAVLFLVGPLNTFVTGQDLIVDGGFTCG